MSKAIPYLWCFFGSIACCGCLFFALWESAQPYNVPNYAFPVSAMVALGMSIAAILSMRRLVGSMAVLVAPALIFLGCIPVWLVLEVTLV